MDEHLLATLTELRRLCARLPVPGAAWHPHAELIAQVHRDFERALAICTVEPALLASLGAPFDESAGGELAAAWQRLSHIPAPDGRHPYLDEILPALEGARAVLACLSRSPQAALAFEPLATAA